MHVNVPWLKQYIGIPFREKGRDRSGCDCWGIPYLVYRERFGIELPSYTEDYLTTTDREEIGALVRREALVDWTAVLIADAAPGDILILRIEGQPIHCGLVIEPPWFLHGIKGSDSCLERWDRPAWRRRVSGLYRHRSMIPAMVAR